ncbi:CoA transferase [Polymorphobacter multimanifer]|uniref:Crotonobetainyl-CoA:carnitine CoA-transferase CaiB-like acyl-CoA transferase n=1 Tax=Polymorphobacter multimanifer TaxID=1070431 RepID=A0A841L7S0_9SPHN|nr:CoA transferase [Polymorphobacter multimanifer]MBB6228480.1 crotonobetainyl-CoA:carnitine CoA-transferase CaiB-like acyl-CoA transferase [Polymorphobacter multimanifer]GGI80456.1 CoA transferase [Polymorphobacter multimanifer]
MTRGPLDGVKVLDLSQIVSGPMAAAMLADQGADVVKLESPNGDPVRGMGPRKGDVSAMFIAVNRGKRGVVADVKTAEGAALLEALIGWADVLVENFRPGTMARLGFGWARCSAINPRLVMASITGFGPDGPYANIRVYDPVVQAVSGIAAAQTDKDGRPSLVKTLIADKVTALTAAQAITAALFRRERTGVGEHVQISMLDAALAFNWPEAMWNLSFLDDAPPEMPAYGAMTRLWQAADGQVAIGAMQTVEFVALVRSLGLDALAEDARFLTAGGRIRHAKDWTGAVGEALAARKLETLMEGFVREGAVGGRVNGLEAVLDDPQVRHNGALTDFAQGAAGRVRGALGAARFAGGSGPGPRAAPSLGEHDAEVRAMVGL